jgi:hypothetical protein
MKSAPTRNRMKRKNEHHLKGSLNMRWLIWVVFAVMIPNAFASEPQNNPPKLLLEARMTGVGMVEVRGDHLYLRVYSNGVVEYESRVTKDSIPRYLIRRSKLSAAKLRELRAFLSSGQIKVIASNYNSISPSPDHTIDLKVIVWQEEQTQTTTITNFFPTSTKAKTVYPASLLELLCRIEKIRKNAGFSITADSEKWCPQM